MGHSLTRGLIYEGYWIVLRHGPLKFLDRTFTLFSLFRLNHTTECWDWSHLNLIRMSRTRIVESLFHSIMVGGFKGRNCSHWLDKIMLYIMASFVYYFKDMIVNYFISFKLKHSVDISSYEWGLYLGLSMWILEAIHFISTVLTSNICPTVSAS